jgi:hypothetical protein
LSFLLFRQDLQDKQDFETADFADCTEGSKKGEGRSEKLEVRDSSLRSE